MKNNNRAAASIAVVCFAALTLTAGIHFFNIRKDFNAKPDIQTYLSEVSDDSIEMKLVEADDMKIGSELILVNKEHPLDDDYSADICEYKDSGVMMNTASVDHFAAMSKDITDNKGEYLYVSSSYRTYEEQQQILEEEGSKTALPPGCSEHETGLAQDLYFSGYAGDSFIKCEAGKYLTEIAPSYGFILRYPKHKTNVTGIRYEPWHFRYVGQPHAEIMTQCGLTLEEYLDSLEYGKFYVYGDHIISRQQGSILEIPQGYKTDISYDNCGGYIITSQK